MIAVYPGSFDPITNGHLDIIKRAARLADKLIVGVLINSAKTALFSVEERRDLIDKAICASGVMNVEVDSFAGLTVEFAKKHGANVLIRGLRTTWISEVEMQMALANRKLVEELETLFLLSDPSCIYISSTLVKEVAALDGCIDEMVPNIVKEAMLQKINNRRK